MAGDNPFGFLSNPFASSTPAADPTTAPSTAPSTAAPSTAASTATPVIGAQVPLSEWQGTLPADAIYPLPARPTQPYTGVRAFGSNRKAKNPKAGPRRHAGVDNYQALYMPVHAITAGTVIEIKRTWVVYKGAAPGAAIAVRHPSIGVIVRYCEVCQTPKSAYDVRVSVGQTVNTGDVLGFLENVYHPAGPMLHAELYASDLYKDGVDTHLDENTGLYRRHKALMKPTDFFLALLATGRLAPATP